MGVVGLWLYAVVVAVVFTGYRAGTWDHWVLQETGTSWADPTAYRNDYFVMHAPQPHWSFDYLIELGVRTGTLQWLYLAYFLLAMLALAVGVHGLMRVLTPTRVMPGSMLATTILAASPFYLFGAVKPVLGIALPAIMGTALASMVIAFALQDRWVPAALAVVLAATLHVQLGTVAAYALAAVLAYRYARARRVELVGIVGVVVAGLVVLANLHARPVFGDLADFVRVCDVIIPFHCDANSWPWQVFASGLSALAATGLAAYTLRRGTRSQFGYTVVAAALVVPELGFIALDYLRVPVLGELVQGSNAYRFGSVIMVLAAVGFASLILRAEGRPASVDVIVLGLLFLYLSMQSGPMQRLRWALAVGLFGVAVLRVRRVSRPRPGAVVAALLCALGLLQAPSVLHGSSVQLQVYYASDVASIKRLVPPGATILADPHWLWLRLETERAVVIDCKYVPYGGKPLAEYFRRLGSLGGWNAACLQDSFATMVPAEIERISREYGAGYVVLAKRDARIGGFVARGWRVLTPTDPRHLALDHGHGLALLQAPVGGSV